MTGEITKEAVEAVLLRARERSTLLTDCVDDTELVAQHSPLMVHSCGTWRISAIKRNSGWCEMSVAAIRCVAT